MAFSYEQNFDALNTAELNGQDSWVNIDSNAVVSGDQSFEASGKSCKIQGGSIYRDITECSSGRIYVAMYDTGLVYAGQYCQVEFLDSSTSKFIIKYTYNTGFSANGTGLTGGVANGVWNMIELEWGLRRDKNLWRARIRPYATIYDAPWGFYTAYANLTSPNEQININKIKISANISDPDYVYVDTFSATDQTLGGVPRLTTAVNFQHPGIV
jgi:hypothetical protein